MFPIFASKAMYGYRGRVDGQTTLRLGKREMLPSPRRLGHLRTTLRLFVFLISIVKSKPSVMHLRYSCGR
jgi:hypothetical protein